MAKKKKSKISPTLVSVQKKPFTIAIYNQLRLSTLSLYPLASSVIKKNVESL